MNYWVDGWVSLWVWGLIWIYKLVIGWVCELIWVCMLMSWWVEVLMSFWVDKFVSWCFLSWQVWELTCRWLICPAHRIWLGVFILCWHHKDGKLFSIYKTLETKTTSIHKDTHVSVSYANLRTFLFQTFINICLWFCTYGALVSGSKKCALVCLLTFQKGMFYPLSYKISPKGRVPGPII